MQLNAETINPQVTVLNIVGTVDHSSAPALEKQILEMVKAGARQVILDFGKLEYISSAGLRVLLVAGKKLMENNGALALCCVQPGVKQIIDTVGFNSIFAIHASREEALGK